MFMVLRVNHMQPARMGCNSRILATDGNLGHTLARHFNRRSRRNQGSIPIIRSNLHNIL